MLLIPCPWCGRRNVDEFSYSGPPSPRPDPARATAGQWREYLFQQDNYAGWVTERWFHRHGCTRYFTIQRHTVSNAIAGGIEPEAP